MTPLDTKTIRTDIHPGRVRVDAARPLRIGIELTPSFRAKPRTAVDESTACQDNDGVASIDRPTLVPCAPSPLSKSRTILAHHIVRVARQLIQQILLAPHRTAERPAEARLQLVGDLPVNQPSVLSDIDSATRTCRRPYSESDGCRRR